MTKYRRMAEALANKGRGGDTILAHITPEEAMMLHHSTDGGSINPVTGLPEFFLTDDPGWSDIVNDPPGYGEDIDRHGGYSPRDVGSGSLPKYGERGQRAIRRGRVYEWREPKPNEDETYGGWRDVGPAPSPEPPPSGVGMGGTDEDTGWTDIVEDPPGYGDPIGGDPSPPGAVSPGVDPALGTDPGWQPPYSPPAGGPPEYGIGGWDAFAGQGPDAGIYAPDYVDALGGVRGDFWQDFNEQGLRTGWDRFGMDTANLLAPPGFYGEPVYDPTTGQRGADVMFSPAGALGGVAGAALGVPFVGTLAEGLGPSYHVGTIGMGEDAGGPFGYGGDDQEDDSPITTQASVNTTPTPAEEAEEQRKKLVEYLQGRPGYTRAGEGIIFLDDEERARARWWDR